MPVNYDEIFIDDDGGIAAILEDIFLQKRELLIRQWREQLGEGGKDGRRLFMALIFDSGIFHDIYDPFSLRSFGKFLSLRNFFLEVNGIKKFLQLGFLTLFVGQEFYIRGFDKESALAHIAVLIGGSDGLKVAKGSDTVALDEILCTALGKIPAHLYGHKVSQLITVLAAVASVGCKAHNGVRNIIALLGSEFDVCGEVSDYIDFQHGFILLFYLS